MCVYLAILLGSGQVTVAANQLFLQSGQFQGPLNHHLLQTVDFGPNGLDLPPHLEKGEKEGVDKEWGEKKK